MKKYTAFICSLNLMCAANAQEEHSGGKEIPADSAYSYDANVNSELINGNIAVWNAIQSSMNAVAFDHCKYPIIEMVAWYNAESEFVKAGVQSGTGMPKADSLFHAIFEQALSSMPVRYANFQKKKYKFLISFLFTSFSSQTKTTRTSGIPVVLGTVAYAQTTITKHTTNRNNCDENDFFYRQGIRQFKEGDLKKAIFSFTECLNHNPDNLDAMYNLAHCYLKIEKTEKACKYLKSASDKGDPDSIHEYEMICRTKNN